MTNDAESEFRLDLLEEYRTSGDPQADAVLQEAADHGGLGEVQTLLNAIINEGDVPAPDEHEALVGANRSAYRSYYEQTVRVPTDFYHRTTSEKQLEVEWYNQYGWTSFSILGCASLPAGYSVAEVAEILASTQELEVHDRKRLYESVQFIIDVMDVDGINGAPDPADESVTLLSGIGVSKARKVRLFHATVRYLIAYQAGDTVDPDYDPYGTQLISHKWNPDLGTPINQGQLAGTLLSFGYVMLWGLETLGYDVDEEMQRALLARWNLVGHVMGIDHELMRWDFGSAKALYEHLRRPGGSADDTEKLMVALVEFMKESVPWWLFPLRSTPAMLMVHLIGEQWAADAGLALTRGQRLWMPIMKMMLGLWARFVQRSDPMRWLSAWLYLRMRRKIMGGSGKPRRFNFGPANGTPGEKHSFQLRLPAGTPKDTEWVDLHP